MIKLYKTQAQFETETEIAHESGEPCQDNTCQECCPHDEHDHYMCIECGKQFEPSDFYNEDEGLER